VASFIGFGQDFLAFMVRPDGQSRWNDENYRNLLSPGTPSVNVAGSRTKQKFE
jgi:hypothetical protein